jgi:hypothetical protein
VREPCGERYERDRRHEVDQDERQPGLVVDGSVDVGGRPARRSEPETDADQPAWREGRRARDQRGAAGDEREPEQSPEQPRQALEDRRRLVRLDRAERPVERDAKRRNAGRQGVLGVLRGAREAVIGVQPVDVASERDLVIAAGALELLDPRPRDDSEAGRDHGDDRPGRRQSPPQNAVRIVKIQLVV